jgi:hypothetical protein
MTWHCTRIDDMADGMGQDYADGYAVGISLPHHGPSLPRIDDVSTARIGDVSNSMPTAVISPRRRSFDAVKRSPLIG